MLAEREIAASFLHYRRLLGGAAMGLVAAMAAFALREASPESSPPWEIAGWLLGVLLLALLAMVGATYYWFRSSMRHLVQLSQARLRMAVTDSLTGALTRASFLEHMRHAMARTASQPVGYIHVDMDNLKVVNDTYGHKAGDAALAHLVGAIRRAAPQAVVGRLGGDEFAVLFEGVSSRDGLAESAQAILDALARPANLKGISLQLSATLGVALAPEDGDCVETVLANADLALYVGKGAGRGRVVPFDREMSKDEQQARFIERELRGAILLDQLTVHYQPIVDIRGEAIGHYEALVRWEHPYRGMVSPADFIPVAERSTLIDSLGDWVLRRVCKERVSLQAASISVNVSLMQLRRAGFAQRFLGILAETQTPLDAIVVEITETVRLSADAIEMRNLEILMDAGVRIAIDDFGSGATSLDYLRRLRFDAIKIDRSYIVNAALDPVSMALIAAVANIGRALDIKVVAEGVETEDQKKMLQAAGCTHLQGYLFGKPQGLPRTSEMALLRRRVA